MVAREGLALQRLQKRFAAGAVSAGAAASYSPCTPKGRHAMDYRHTEDFARQMEAAALRARHLRGEAVEQFWNAIGAALRRLWHRLQHRHIRTRGA
jgi:hypothetical protein